MIDGSTESVENLTNTHVFESIVFVLSMRVGNMCGNYLRGLCVSEKNNTRFNTVNVN